MKIESLNLHNLQNSEHFQFMSEVSHVIESNNPQNIDVDAEYNTFGQALKTEDEAYKQVQKSAITKTLSEADAECDTMLRGFRSQVSAQQKHFNPTISAAAYRLFVLLDSYGDLSKQSYETQTANTFNLLQDLKGKYADDVTVLGLNEWVTEIERSLKAFDALMKSRYAESAEKAEVTTLRMVRLDTDKAYKAMSERLNAAIVFNGETKYSKTVTELNVLVKRYKDIVARRKGFAASQKEN